MLTLRSLAALAPVAFLSGCNSVLMNPSGSVAAQQSRLIVQSTVLMLLIVIPVIVLTVVFAWRYRQSNKEATYTPDWDHSTQLELVIWAAPLLIIIALGALTWISSHTLDPFRPLRRLDSARAIPAQLKPLTIEVVALDWKWLFIYPEQGIATVNEVAAPVDVPINFKITASSVMNSFFVPALAGQVYAMPGMQTQLNAVMNSPGEYEGFSANYSGAGFSGMHFKFKGLAPQAFSQWVQSVKGSGQELSKERYRALAAPSEREPVHLYSSVDASLYDAILNQCVATSCLSAQASN
jgi:cytochrome o ubiquinol oxidase subunit II